MSRALVSVTDHARALLTWRGFVGRCLVYCPTSVVARVLTGPEIPQRIMRRWCESIVRDVGIEVEAEGLEKIDGTPSVIVVNHASMLDVPVVGALLDIDYRWVAKKQLFDVPLVGWHLRACGHIPVDRGRRGNLERMQQRVEQVLGEGGSVLFFPEGTRSADGALKEFRAGAFACAERAGAPILPIVLDGTEKLLAKGSLEFPRRADEADKRVRVRVLDRVIATDPGDAQARANALRMATRRRMVEALDALRGGPGLAEQATG